MSDTSTDAGAEASAYSQLGMQAMLDLAAPQPNYRELIEQGGYVSPAEGVALSFARARNAPISTRLSVPARDFVTLVIE